MSEIKWEEPPPPVRGKAETRWDLIGAALRERPGEWAFVTTCSSSSISAATARNIRDGLYAHLRPAKSFEAAARTVDGEYRVYARYVGEVPA